MESWCFDSYVSNETALRNPLLGCDFKGPDTCYPPEGIADILVKQRDAEDESCSNVGASSLVDLKLGGLSDRILDSDSSGVAGPAESTIAGKRGRGGVGLSSQVVYCQVYGCGRDLSFEKDYHKRHRVCDVHSKTARVVVDGVEQRFCQQCSRFHLLAEFDDGKRSCRKRLAGHNERRRKPQVGAGRNRSGRSLRSYTGSISSKFHMTTLAAPSIICQDIVGPTRIAKHPSNSWSRGIKIENEASAYCQLEQKTILPRYLSEKQYTSVTDNHVYTDNINQYPCETNAVGGEDLTLYDTATAIQGIPGMSESGCALSLLSPQSHTSHSSNASVIQSSCPQFGAAQVYGDVDVDVAVEFANGTVDGLSLQLQQVENEWQSRPVKQDTGRFMLF